MLRGPESIRLGCPLVHQHPADSLLSPQGKQTTRQIGAARGQPAVIEYGHDQRRRQREHPQGDCFVTRGRVTALQRDQIVSKLRDIGSERC